MIGKAILSSDNRLMFVRVPLHRSSIVLSPLSRETRNSMQVKMNTKNIKVCPASQQRCCKGLIVVPKSSLTCFEVAVVVARLAEQVVRRCYVDARLTDHTRRVDEKGGVGPARVLNKVGPGHPVQAGVEDGPECSLGVPDHNHDDDPHRLIHVGQDVVERVFPISPAIVDRRCTYIRLG